MSLMTSMNQIRGLNEQSESSGDRRLAVLSDGRSARSAGDTDALLTAHWPESVRPVLNGFGYADALGRKDVLEALRLCDAALIWAGETDSPADLRAVAALLTEHAVPSVVNLPTSLAHLTASLQTVGATVHLQGRGDAVLAALLSGLSQRQQAVRELEVELRSRRAAQKQVHSWVSKVDNELLLASKLQRELMRADDFSVPGLSTSVVYRPAWYVSGDCYRLLRLDENHAGFMVSDAMGHGISAAMYGMIIANGLTMKEVGTSGYKLLDPGAALGKINGLLLNEESDQTRFATSVCARMNLHSGELLLASAGHPPALILSGKGAKARRFDSTGPVLGVFADSPFDVHTARLVHGETLALYTDGFGEIVGEEQVEGYLAETIDAADGDVKRAAGLIERFLDARPGSLTPGDDATVIMVRRG